MKPLTPRQTREKLDALAHRANKTLGQNFLIDGNIVRKSIEMSSLEQGSTVVEIGPGLGTLSQALLGAGCHVYAVEKDPTLARELDSTLVPNAQGMFELVEGDALDFPLAGLPESSTEDFSIVANLPYAITTPWLETVLRGKLPKRMVLMMQKEAGDRLQAKPSSKAFGAITVFLAAAYKATGNFRVSRNCFYPVPGVDSVLLRLDMLERPRTFSPEIREAIRTVFTQRRKQIGAAARDVQPLQSWLNNLADTTIRAEAIPVETWLELADTP